MSSVSNLIILLDLVEAGLRINSRVANLLREAETEGRDVSAEELVNLADENDTLYDEVMSKL